MMLAGWPMTSCVFGLMGMLQDAMHEVHTASERYEVTHTCQHESMVQGSGCTYLQPDGQAPSFGIPRHGQPSHGLQTLLGYSMLGVVQAAAEYGVEVGGVSEGAGNGCLQV